jgi:hypothetical protein
MLTETAVVREYARWCGGTAAKAASYPIKGFSLSGSYRTKFGGTILQQILDFSEVMDPILWTKLSPSIEKGCLILFKYQL